MSANRNVKIAVVVLGFAAAGTIYAVTSGGGEADEKTPEDVQMVDLVCVESGTHVRLPFEEIRVQGMRPRGGRGRATQEGSDAQVVIYQTSECGTSGAVLADYCTACEVYYAKRLPDGSVGTCPECSR